MDDYARTFLETLTVALPESLLKQVNPQRVLDIGFGTPYLPELFQKYAETTLGKPVHYVGADVIPTFVDQANQENKHSHMEYVLVGHDSTFTDNFDLVVSFNAQTFGHEFGWRESFRWASDWHRKGGLMFATCLDVRDSRALNTLIDELPYEHFNKGTENPVVKETQKLEHRYIHRSGKNEDPPTHKQHFDTPFFSGFM